MRRVVIINFKGGVGKTTTAVNVAHGLALSGFRVLLVDNDPQANSTFIFTKDVKHSLTSLFKNQFALEEAILTVRPNLDLVPASKSLSTINTWLVEQQVPRRAQVLEKILSPAEGYDFIIVDTAPSFSLLNANAITFASEAWVPVAMEYLALANIRELMNTFSTAKSNLGKDLPISYVIPFLYDRRNKKSKQIYNILIDIFGDIVTNPIHIDVRVSEAPYFSKSILEYNPQCRGANDFRRLIRRIIDENSLYRTDDLYSAFFSG
ncbi:MAG: ParA family protein [Acidobacteria bacterium]|nr:ParA family protein [Acidobacteriota bacterium]